MEDKHYKIYRYCESAVHPEDEAPVDVNYKTGLTTRLHPVLTWSRGRITEVGMYASASLNAQGEVEGTDLVVKETFSYTDDASGLARHRLMTITWYTEDGEAGQVKHREKYYNNADSRTEGRRRRRNVIDQISIKVVGMVAATEQVDFATAIGMCTPWMDAKVVEVSMYIETAADGLKQAIINDTSSEWLNNLLAPGVSIRGYLIGEL